MRQAAPTQWFGGKSNLSLRIADLLPPHRAYVEPFGGAASVLFTKTPAPLEVYNDVHDGLVTFFRVLRDRPDELVDKLQLTPYARAEFELCRDSWRDVEDDLERARRFWLYVNSVFASKPTGTAWAVEYRGRSYLSRPKTMVRRVERMYEWAGRLRGVQIENLDFREILDRYDSDEACFYIDPPYMAETRRGVAYADEMSTADHEDLVERVRCLAGTVVLSGYDSSLYRTLEADGFERIEFPVVCYVPGNEWNGSPRLEVVWRRGDHAQGSLLDRAVGE